MTTVRSGEGTTAIGTDDVTAVAMFAVMTTAEITAATAAATAAVTKAATTATTATTARTVTSRAKMLMQHV